MIEENSVREEFEVMTVEQFDTIEGFKEAIDDGCLCSLNDIIANRKQYVETNGTGKLREFIVFGEYIFSGDGNVAAIFTTQESRTDVQLLEDFISVNPGISSVKTRHVIPSKEQYCKYCGEEFMAFDLRDKPCQKCDEVEQFYHVSCASK